MSVNLTTHKLVALATLDDGVGEALSANASDTYWRGFLIQDRATGELSFKFRFQYTDRASWMQIQSREPLSIEAWCDRIQKIFGMLVLSGMSRGVTVEPDACKLYVVPEADREDSGRTCIWMEMQDLVHPPRFEDLSGNEVK